MQRYREIVLCDFEFCQQDGETPEVLCMVARELHSGKTHRYWIDQLGKLPPFSIDEECLFVAYAASAELSCFLELGWPMPASTLDLYFAFRAKTNGSGGSASLLSALNAHGLPTMEAAEKESMRELAMRGGPYSTVERISLLEYCEQDVIALEMLLPRMWPNLDLPREIVRGRYCEAVARYGAIRSSDRHEGLQSTSGKLG